MKRQWFIINKDKLPFILKNCSVVEIIEEYETQIKVSIIVTAANLTALLYSGVQFGMEKMTEQHNKVA